MLQPRQSRVGIALSGIYTILFLLSVLIVLVSTPDGLSIIVPIALTFPWSVLLLETIPEGFAVNMGPIAFILIFLVSAGLNALILYSLGWIYSSLARKKH